MSCTKELFNRRCVMCPSQCWSSRWVVTQHNFALHTLGTSAITLHCLATWKWPYSRHVMYPSPWWTCCYVLTILGLLGKFGYKLPVASIVGYCLQWLDHKISVLAHVKIHVHFDLLVLDHDDNSMLVFCHNSHPVAGWWSLAWLPCTNKEYRTSPCVHHQNNNNWHPHYLNTYPSPLLFL